MAAPPDAILAIASAMPLAAFGVLLLGWRRRRDALFFGLFALAWAAQVVAVNVGRVLDSVPVHRAGLFAGYALAPVAALYLARFVDLQRRGKPWLTGGALLFAMGGLLVMLVAPEQVIRSVHRGEQAMTVSLGLAAIPFFIAFHGCFFAAIPVLYRQFRLAEPGTQRNRYRAILRGFALYTSYLAVSSAIGFLRSGTIGLDGVAEWGVAAFYLAGAFLVGAVVAHAAMRPPHPEEADWALVAAFVIPAAVAVAELFLAQWNISPYTVGLWRIGTVAFLAHALANLQWFDFQFRLQRFAGPAAAALLFSMVAAYAAVRAFTHGASAAGAPLVIGFAAAAVTWRVAARMSHPPATDVEAYLEHRRLEVYRAALEQEARTPSRRGAAQLRHMRRQLGLSQEVHDIMSFMVGMPNMQTERAQPGALLRDRYRVERLLGEGGHGRAYLAHDLADDRSVVIKAVGTHVQGGQAANRLLREARLMGSLDHPNVIRLYDAWPGDKEAFMVIEHAAGGNLQQLLRRRGRLPVDEATALIQDVLAGLGAAHAAGLVHRDIKPENVLLGDRVKLADFGVAIHTGPDATGLEGGAGTMLYMSPEQVRQRPTDARSDLYSVAVMFHLLLTGRFYLRIAGRDDFAVRKMILQSKPQALPDVPAGMAAFMAKALAKDPDQRFQDAATMREALAAIVPVAAIVASPAGHSVAA